MLLLDRKELLNVSIVHKLVRTQSMLLEVMVSIKEKMF